LNDKERRKVIIDFIIQNQGCTKEKVVKNVNHLISRKPVFTLLYELKKQGIVRDEKRKPNSRDYNLYVDSDNPLVYVYKELDEFENMFLGLLTKALSVYNKINKTDKYITTPSIELSAGSIELMIYPIHLFHDVVNIYNIHSMIRWPYKIHNKLALKNLYFDVLTKISEIQIGIMNTFDRLRPHMKETTQILLTSIFHDRLLVNQWNNYPSKLVKYYDFFNQFGMKDQIEPIFDFIWKISSSYKDYLYYDEELNKSYHYEDGWKKLLDIARKKSNPND
jgi:hypothetical protein